MKAVDTQFKRAKGKELGAWGKLVNNDNLMTRASPERSRREALLTSVSRRTIKILIRSDQRWLVDFLLI